MIFMSLPGTEVAKFLGSIQPFKSLNASDLKAIVPKTTVKSFSKGETIFSEGEKANSVWVLYEGRVQILKYTSGGKPFAIEALGPGELFGTLCRLGGNGRNYPCTAVAADLTTTLRILDRTFLEYYMKSPGMARGVCALCSDRLKDVQDLRCVAQESVMVRVVSILMRLHRVHGDLIPFTKKEISELAGTTLETTFRTLSDFQKRGYLTSLRGKIHIRKPTALNSIVDQC